MTKKTDLMGLGVPWQQADVLGDTPTLFTAVGTTVGSAAQIPGRSRSAALATSPGSPAARGSGWRYAAGSPRRRCLNGQN